MYHQQLRVCGYFQKVRYWNHVFFVGCFVFVAFFYRFDMFLNCFLLVLFLVMCLFVCLFSCFSFFCLLLCLFVCFLFRVPKATCCQLTKHNSTSQNRYYSTRYVLNCSAQICNKYHTKYAYLRQTLSVV